MYTVVVAVFLSILAVFLRSLYGRKVQYRALSGLPGPPSNYLWGNLFEFNKHIEDTFENFVGLNKKYGPIVVLWPHPWKPLVVLAHAKFIERILSTNTHLGKTSLYECMQPFLGRSLVTSEVDAWKRIRKQANTAFQPKIFDSFIPVFEYHENRLINILKTKSQSGNIDLPTYVDLYVLDAVCELMTNVKTNFQETSDNGYLKARSDFLTIFMNRAYSWVKRSKFLFFLTKEHEVQKKCVVTLKKFSQYLIDTRKEARKQSKVVDNDNGLNKTVLDLFMDADISETNLRDHVDTFIVAGHDTPGSTIAFSLYELANHPEIQAKVVEESISILGKDPNAVVTIQDLQNMNYLDCVIKEILRYYTTVPAHERLLDEDITIDGITLPKGTEVSISIYATHHNEKYFPNPHVFDPDRFSPENVHKIQPYTYLPFTKGPRDCIGKTMAMLMMKSVITKVIRNFQLLPVSPPHTPKPTSEFVLKSANGLPVKMRSRIL
ncbi:cytochrome P450 [Oryctes borbonicus]|uniref:Cytochrome P450 n=1 Tax=Oryctes borbonicus TaxID=1629725 RepID=A0A0T6B675_9SCAR|nr:cytochrome P450 [Oryctes borbonicus]